MDLPAPAPLAAPLAAQAPAPSPAHAPAVRLRRLAAERLLVALLLLATALRTAGGSASHGSTARGAQPPPPPLAIDLAHDPAERLLLLPGIGPTRARAVVAAREEHGTPRRLEDLERVRGIGKATLAGLTAASEVRVLVDGREITGRRAAAEPLLGREP